MAAKHTPGPWRWNGPNQLWGGEREADEILKAEDDRKPYGMHSALIEHHWDLDVAKANRDLIAAAPDLLEALRGLDEAYCRAGTPLTRDERNEDRKRLIAARAAIAKATGGAS